MSGWGQATAQVLRVRRARFVEFALTVERDLSVELVLPYPQFRSFCHDHDIDVLPSDAEIEAELRSLLAAEMDRVTAQPAAERGADQAGSR